MITVGVNVRATTGQAQTEIEKVGASAKRTATTVAGASAKTSADLDRTAGAASRSRSAFTGLGSVLGTVAGSIAGAGFSYLLGDVLGLPGPIQDVVTAVGGLAPGLLEAAGGFSGLRTMAASAASTLSTGLKAGASAAAAGLSAGFSSVVTFTRALFSMQTVTKIATGVQLAFNAVMALNPFILIIAAVIAVVAIFTLLYLKVAWFRNAVNVVLGAYIAYTRFVFATVIAIVRGVIAFFGTVASAIGAALAPVGRFILAPYLAGWNAVRALWAGAGSLLSGVVGSVASALSGVYEAVVGPFRSAWNFIENNVISPIRSAWNGVANVVNSVSLSTPSVSVAGHTIIPALHWSPPHIPTLAAGGVFDAATLAVVGEAGREIVTPERLLRQIVNGGPGAGARAVNLTVNVNVAPGANPAEVGRQTVRMLQAYVRANGPGSFTRALGGA